MGMLLTDWLVIGTSGPTVDGREISADDLKIIAETYDPSVYTAVVNIEHSYGNLGTVRQLRTAAGAQGKTALQARIRPNKYFLTQNAEDHRLFFSMEITRNFLKSGKPYLTGLATTDTPASIGTTELHFSAQPESPVERGESTEVSSDVLFNCKEESQTLFNEFLARLRDILAKGKTTKKEPEEMTSDEIKAIVAAEMQPVMEKLASLTEKLEKFNEKPVDEVPAEVEKPQDFSDLLKPICEKLDALSNQFAQILSEAPSTKFAAGKGAAENETAKFI